MAYDPSSAVAAVSRHNWVGARCQWRTCRDGEVCERSGPDAGHDPADRQGLSRDGDRGHCHARPSNGHRPLRAPRWREPVEPEPTGRERGALRTCEHQLSTCPATPLEARPSIGSRRRAQAEPIWARDQRGAGNGSAVEADQASVDGWQRLQRDRDASHVCGANCHLRRFREVRGRRLARTLVPTPRNVGPTRGTVDREDEVAGGDAEDRERSVAARVGHRAADAVGWTAG